MNTSDDLRALLLAVEVPPTTADIGLAVATARRQTARRGAILAGATATLVVAVGTAVALGVAPTGWSSDGPAGQRPEGGPFAACTVDTVEVGEPAGSPAVDPSGRLVVATVGGTAARIADGRAVPYPGATGHVVAVNTAGLIVGFDPVDNDVHQLAWTYRDGRKTTLPKLTGYPYTTPTAVNARGDVVGYATPQTGDEHVPLLWPAERPGTVVALATPAGFGSPGPAGFGSPDTTSSGSPGPSGSGSPGPSGSGSPNPTGSGSPSSSSLGSPDTTGLGSPGSTGSGSPDTTGSGSPSPSGLGSPDTTGSGWPGLSGAQATGVADDGTVVGVVHGAPTRWTSDGAPDLLPLPTGYQHASIRALRGTYAYGWATVTGGSRVAPVRWHLAHVASQHAVTVLEGAPYDIIAGTPTGWSITGGTKIGRPARLTPDGTVERLPLPPGVQPLPAGPGAVATSVSDDGAIITGAIATVEHRLLIWHCDTPS